MTIEAGTVAFSYTGDGASTSFPFPSKFLDTTDIHVSLNGLVQTTGYTVTGANNNSGGSVVFASAPASGVAVFLYREPSISQLTAFQENGATHALTFENISDKLTMIAQLLRFRISRALSLPDMTASGPYDAQGRRITHLGDPFDASDAVNLQTLGAAIAAALATIGTGGGSGGGGGSIVSLLEGYGIDIAFNSTTGAYTISVDPAVVGGGSSYIAAGTGAVPRTVQNRIRDLVPSFLDYRASGDADDTAAINRALAAGPAVYIGSDAAISGPVTVPGLTTSTAIPNKTMIFGPQANLIKTGSGALVNKGFVVGIGYHKDDDTGLWKDLSSSFTELYGAALHGHGAGDMNGLMGSIHQNGQAGNGFPCANVAYGLNTDPGNTVFGFFGRADARAAGVATHEFNTFNFFGDPGDVIGGFPSRGWGIPVANPITMTIACGGSFPSTAAIQITREGTPENTAQANYKIGIHMDYITDIGLKFNSDGSKGPTGSPKHCIWMYTGPNTQNGLLIQAVGKNGDYSSNPNPYLIAASSHRNLDNGNPDTAYNCFSVTMQGDVAGKTWTIAANGDFTLGGGMSSGGQVGFTGGTVTGTPGSGSKLFANNYQLASSASHSTLNAWLPVSIGGGTHWVPCYL